MFLDEIGELPLSLQPKLLRVLQNGELYAVGSSRVKKVNVRLVAATNQYLPKMMTDGQFREDLYFRVNSLEIALKRLVDRVEDLMLLAKHFAEQHQATRGRLELSEYDIFYWLHHIYIPNIFDVSPTPYCQEIS